MKIVAFLIALWWGCTLSAQAAEPTGITVTPAFQEITLGESSPQAPFAVVVTNHTENEVAFRLSTADFGSLDESGGVAFLGDSANVSGRYGLARWMTLENTTLTLASGATGSIPVQIQNSDELTPGGHYGAVLLETILPEKSFGEANPVAINQRFSALVFLKKIGGEIYGLSLEKIEKVSSGLWLPATAKLRFQNTGNVHIVPRGIVTIQNPFGREVAKGILNQESALLLPEQNRNYQVTLQKTALVWMPGMYRLIVDERYDGKEDFHRSEQAFFLFPWTTLLTLFIAGAFIAGFFFWRRRAKREV